MPLVKQRSERRAESDVFDRMRRKRSSIHMERLCSENILRNMGEMGVWYRYGYWHMSQLVEAENDMLHQENLPLDVQRHCGKMLS